MQAAKWTMIWLIGVLLVAGCMKKNEMLPGEIADDSSEENDTSTSTPADSSQKHPAEMAEIAAADENDDSSFSEDDSAGTDVGQKDELESDQLDTSTETDGLNNDSDGVDTDSVCIADEVTTAQCDADGNVVGLNVCGETVGVIQECADVEECVEGECVCPEGWTGDECLVPVVFVNIEQGADIGNSGRTWATAFSDIQDALETAYGEGEVEIWVAQGTYVPGTTRDSTFQLSDGVRVYGGFAGIERALLQRDVNNYLTILDGDINQDDDGTFNMHADNVRHVVTGAEGAVLDGVTIRGGNADGDAESHNDDGGGLLAVGVSVTVSNCIFAENHAAASGGGMMMSSPYGKVLDSVFITNQALSGAGLSLAPAGEEHDGMRVHNVLFQNNVADSSGGGVHIAAVSPRFGGCTFLENSASSGGGVYAIVAESPVFSRCIFEGNLAQSGGAMYNAGSNSWVDNSLFQQNSAELYAGAMMNTSYATSPSGAVGSSDAVIRNCTMVQNSAGEGASALYNSSGNVSVNNSIIWDNILGSGSSNGQVFTSSVDAQFSIGQTVLQDGCEAADNVTCGEGVLNVEPRFVNAAAGNWHLSADSPCVDGGNSQEVAADWLDVDGDNNTGENIPLDLDGNARIVDGNQNGESVVDMGAYEFIPDDISFQ